MKIHRKILLIIFTFYIFNLKNVYGISENFEFVINTIGIPRYNVYGQEINEDVYYEYNVFAYSSPREASQNASQGFQETDYGKWTIDDRKYSGYGQRGEYYYLGREYNGSLISNVYYPVSFFPDTTPEYWNYMYINGAYDSWNDRSKFKYEEQIQYMKQSKIMYDTLDFEHRKTNPYNLIKYNITAADIGFDKIMLDTCSTWKTQGIMNVVRKDQNGAIRYSIFATEPMAASASVKSKLIVNDNYLIDENEKEKDIVISFGADAINLTDYAKVKHIKEIKAELYINGEKVSVISASKEKSLSKNYIYTLSRQRANSYPLYIEVKSSLYTEFAVDGLMQDGLSKEVNIEIKEYKTMLESAEIKELSKENSKLLVSPLIRTESTENSNSSGIVQCGRHICLKLKTDYDVDAVNIYINNNKEAFRHLKTKDGYIYIEIDLQDIKNTVASWAYLRNTKGNYFLVSSEDIGKRVASPNEIKIVINSVEKIILFDTIDNFNMNINYKMYNVINTEEINDKIEFEKW